MQTEIKQFSFLTIFFIALTCIFIGGFIGAVTNMINGAVSPFYFKVIMNWNFPDIWAAAVAQGVFEGLIYGVIFSIVFTTGFGIITKGKAGYIFGLKQLLKIGFIVFLSWIFGGLVSTFLATLSPYFFKSHFSLSPTDKIGMIKFAWVGGSIWGSETGGLLGLFWGVIMIKNNWRKDLNSEN